MRREAHSAGAKDRTSPQGARTRTKNEMKPRSPERSDMAYTFERLVACEREVQDPERWDGMS